MTTTALEQHSYSDRQTIWSTAVIHTLASMFSTFNAWNERSRGRSRFVRLNNHLLNDIGLTREEAREAVDKPFWRE